MYMPKLNFGEMVCKNCGAVIKRAAPAQMYCKECAKILHSEAKQRASDKYNAKAYERITLRVRTGEKDRILAHADSQNESLNSFVYRAVTNQIEEDNKK